MPKIYTKDTWVDEVLADDPRYDILEDGGGAFKADMQINLSTTVSIPGTALNASRANNIENGIDGLDTKIADSQDAITTAGTSTAYTVTTPGAKALATGERLFLKFHTTAGATPTLNRDGQGAKSIKVYNSAGAKVAAGAASIIANMYAEIVYDGTDYVILDPLDGTGGTVPIAAGGTGQVTASAALDALTVEGANIAAAATTNIGAGTGETITITGNTTITAFDTVAAGIIRILKFTGTPLLTYNATSLKLPGAVDYQVVAGDILIFESKGSGNWECVGFTLSTGESIIKNSAIYGDGIDGAVILNGTNTVPWATLSGSTYTMTRNAYLTNLTVNVSIILITAGYQLFGTGTLSNSGTIHNNGSNAAANVAGAGGLGGFYAAGLAGGAGIASGGAAGAGGTSAPPIDNSTLIGGVGGRGAAGWVSVVTQQGGSSVAGSTLINTFPSQANGGLRISRNLDKILSGKFWSVAANTTLQLTPALGGGGGAKSAIGTTCNSGGGGGGGGFVFLSFFRIVNTGTISSNGGNGGNAAGTGANAGGGAGGAGGVVWAICKIYKNTGTVSVNGGTGGTSVALGTTPLKAVARATMGTATSLVGSTITIPSPGNFEPAINTLYILGVASSGGTLSTPTCTGWGLTWNLITTVDYGTIASPTRRLSLFYAYGTPVLNDDNLGSGVVVTFSSAPSSARAFIDEIQNATGTIVQSATNRSDSAATLTATLAAVGSANAAVYGYFALADTAVTPVAGAGFTLLTNSVATHPSQVSEMSYNDTTVDLSWTNAGACAGIAIEIQAVASMESGQAGLVGQVIQLQN